jgi:hypothetical protein
MSDYMEMIDVKTMMCKLLCNGEVVAEYKVEQCDKCSRSQSLTHLAIKKAMTSTRKSFGFAVVADECVHASKPNR